MAKSPTQSPAELDEDDAVRGSFVRSLPAELAPRDAVTLAQAKGIALSERDVLRLRAQQHSADATPARRGWLGSSVRWHGLIFMLCNGFLVTINLVFSPSVLWFLWVTGTWGMGFIVHAFAASELAGGSARRVKPAARQRSRAPSSEKRRRGSRSAAASSAPELGFSATQLSQRPPPMAAGPDASDVATLGALGTLAASADSGEQPTQLRPVAESPSPPAPRQASLRVRQRIAGRFLVERALGAGGMGEVYLARDETLGEVVALKTIATTLVSAAALDRFRREAQAARRITHPNVVRIHDIGQDGELAFISMEYIAGVTLGRRIEQESPLPLPELKRIALQLCAGLQAAHAAGVVHRDLKPENILLDASGQVRIIDFGLARLEQGGGLTATGMVMGTPEYMAPEQLLGKTIDARTDVYALGCVLYHAVAGHPPFVRDTAVALGMAHCNEAPAGLLAQRAELPAAWEALILRALEKAPEQRWPSADAVRQALEAL